MLKSLSRSLPFLLIRTLLVLGEGATLYYSSMYVHDWFVVFMSNYVEGLFLTVVSPMGYLVGLGLGTILVKYVFGLVQYYFKLAHIVFVTTLILEYTPFKGSRFLHALIQASTHFGSLALNDFSTKGVVKVLGVVKETIMDAELLSKFKEPKSMVVKFVKSICTKGLTNVINMTDEIIVSYTWFTNDMYLQDRKEKGKGVPSVKQKVKNTATFMLEGMAFTIRVLPQLLINSLIFEVAFILLANTVTIASLFVLLKFVGFNFLFFVYAFILYRTLVKLFYYVVVESLRLSIYINSFYSELNDLEPFDINATLARLFGSVPLVGTLIKKSGQSIEPAGSEGSPIFEDNLQEMFRQNVAEVASAFNLNTDELLEEPIEEDVVEVEPEESGEVVNEVESSEVEEAKAEEPTEEPSVPVVQEDSPIPVEGIELDFETQSSPFNSSNRVENQRR